MTAMIKPNSNRVVISKEKVSDRSETGLYIPNADKKSTNQGTVVCVGDVSEEYGGYISIGSFVLYELTRNAHEIDINGESYLTINIEDIICVIM